MQTLSMLARAALAALVLALVPPMLAAQSTPPPVPVDDTATPPPLPADDDPAPTPPPLPQLAVFLDEDGNPGGPYDRAQLTAKVADGTLTGQTLVWQDGMADWAPAAEVEDLAGLIGPAPGPSPSPQPEPQQDPAALIAGDWFTEGSDPTSGLSGQLWVSFDAGGSYTMQGSFSSQQGNVNVEGNGSWRANPGPNDTISVAFTGVIYAIGPDGMPQSEVFNETWRVEVVDQNTLRDLEDGTLLTRQ
ncbi:MAG: protein of unknown function containing DUF4339 domain [Rhodobacteraceae bacterium HLUCCA08]|nr:MAG: protein of unknown function containing DUF4339 domain [Rhodobacteraceae bacterium HLUCCA08]